MKFFTWHTAAVMLIAAVLGKILYELLTPMRPEPPGKPLTQHLGAWSKARYDEAPPLVPVYRRDGEAWSLAADIENGSTVTVERGTITLDGRIWRGHPGLDWAIGDELTPPDPEPAQKAIFNPLPEPYADRFAHRF